MRGGGKPAVWRMSATLPHLSANSERFMARLLGCGLVWMLLSAPVGNATAAPCVPPADLPVELRQIPIERRIHAAPPAVTALALRRNLGNGVAVEPRPGNIEHPVVPALYRMLADLSPGIRRLARNHLAAIYLLQGNFGSARVEAAWDQRGRPFGGCILLNLDAMARTANSWISWRENSAFRVDDRYGINVTLEPPETDSVENALRFVFLHELGHILGLAAGVHGFWAAPETWGLTARSPFTNMSWTMDGSGFTSVWRRRFPLLTMPRFYRFERAPLARSAAPLVYSALGETDWPSLYGSIDPYEDFAETFAIYIHTKLLGRPYRVDIHLGPTRIGEYRSCLETGRCAQKAAYIERLLAMRID